MRYILALLVSCCALFGGVANAWACTPASNPNSIYGNYVCQSNSTQDAPVMWQPDFYLVFWGWTGCGPGIEDPCSGDVTDYRHVVQSLVADYGPGDGYGGHTGLPGTKWASQHQQYWGALWGYPGTFSSFLNGSGSFHIAPNTNSPTHVWFDNSNPYYDPSCTGVPDCGNQRAQDEVNLAQVHFGLQPNTESVIVLVRPWRESLADRSNPTFAYHSALQPKYGYNQATVYVDLNYQGNLSVPNSSAGAQYQLAHEISELITNPRIALKASWDTSQEIGDLCQNSGQGPGIVIALQPRTKPEWAGVFVRLQSDIAGSSGACSYATAWNAHQFGIGGNYHIHHQDVIADARASGGPNTGDHTPYFNWPRVDNNPGWVDWGNLATPGSTSTLSGGPAAASWGPGRIDVFNLNAAGEMKHAYVDSQLGCYSANNTAPCVDNWGVAPYPYTFVGEPAVTSWGPQRLDVFAMAVSSGNPGVLFHRSWDAGLDSGWVLRGNPQGTWLKTSPTATGYSPITTPNTAAGRVDVFVVGVDNQIYNGRWNGSVFTWSLWSTYPSGYALVSKAAAASWSPGRMDVMVVDANGNLWDCWGTNFTGPAGGPSFGACSLWSPPSGITFTDGAGNVVASPGIVALGDQRLVVSMRGSDGQLWMKLWHWGQYTGPWIASGGWLAGGQTGLAEAQEF